MNIKIRIPRRTYAQMVEDFHRPHAHAWERVGFAFGRVCSAGKKDVLILLADYRPVLDEHYIVDGVVGARFNHVAIRDAMQRGLDLSASIFWVHPHEFGVVPQFSLTDVETLRGLVRGFRNLLPGFPHGGLILGQMFCLAKVWLPNSTVPRETRRIVTVGWPTFFHEVDGHE